MTETTRALLLDRPLGSELLVAVAWCVGLAAVGLLWATRLYDRRSIR